MNNELLNNLIEIYLFVFLWQKIDSCIKESIKIWQLNFFSKKLIHVKKTVYLRFKLFKILGQCPKAIHGRTHLNKIKKPC